MDGVSGYKLYLCENSNTDSCGDGSSQGLLGALPALEQDSWDRVVLATEQLRVTHPEGQAATQASAVMPGSFPNACVMVLQRVRGGGQVRHT